MHALFTYVVSCDDRVVTCMPCLHTSCRMMTGLSIACQIYLCVSLGHEPHVTRGNNYPEGKLQGIGSYPGGGLCTQHG